LLVEIVDATASEIEAHLAVFAHGLGKPAGGLDDVVNSEMGAE
jgi:hypothetical protein